VKKTDERKCGGATVRGQLCMDNIAMGVNESNDSSISESSESLSTSLLLLSSSPSFLLPRFFYPPYMIAIASSAWRTFASSLIVFSLVVRCFRFFELVHVFNVVYLYL